MKDNIKTYEQADHYLGAKRERPYAHNTRLERQEDVIFVKYHGNPVVAFLPDGEIIFSSCGWKTITTKERLNWFLPDGFRVYQDKSIWYLSEYQNGRYIFADGISIKNGQVMNAAPETEQAEVKAKIKAIKSYVQGYVSALLAGEIKSPSAGDCFYCVMRTQDGESLGDATKNTSHMDSHLEESYYVPSLLVNAIEFSGRASDFSKSGIAQLWQGESISDWHASIVGRDVKSCLTHYLKHSFGLAQ